MLLDIRALRYLWGILLLVLTPSVRSTSQQTLFSLPACLLLNDTCPNVLSILKPPHLHRLQCHNFAGYVVTSRELEVSDAFGTTYCIYAEPSFSRGQGIAVLTTSPVRESILNSKALSEPALPTSRPFTVAELPGRGMSAIASKSLYPGDLVIAEQASIIFHESAYQNFRDEKFTSALHTLIKHLPHHTQRNFYALSGWPSTKDRADAIVQANSFAVQLGEKAEAHRAILIDASRLNHDCRPNVNYYFDDKTLTLHMHVLRPILAGEELTISYVDPMLAYEPRHSSFAEYWGFNCTCSTCSLSPSNRAYSDHRLSKIAKLEKQLHDFSGTSSPENPEQPPFTAENAIATAEYLISLIKQERLDSELAPAYSSAAFAYNSAGDDVRAMMYASLAISEALISYGSEWEWFNDMIKVESDPKKHWTWRIRLL